MRFSILRIFVYQNWLWMGQPVNTVARFVAVKVKDHSVRTHQYQFLGEVS